jgi:hypothetical protein
MITQSDVITVTKLDGAQSSLRGCRVFRLNTQQLQSLNSATFIMSSV